MSTSNLLIPAVIAAQDNKEVTINEGWELLDLKITGTYTQDFGADADETPSPAEVAAWRKATRILVTDTGGPLTLARDLLLDDTAVAFYIIRDDTTGGQVVTFRTVSGSGITLSKNRYKLCYHDGTDILEIGIQEPQDGRVALTPAATVDVDFKVGGVQTLTLANDPTTLNFTNLELGATVLLEIKSSASNEDLTMDSDAKILSGGTYITDESVNYISLYCNDGVTPEVLATFAA